MKTDLPLKRITHICAQDLLPLLGEHQSTVLGVETLELPASKHSLDTVLRLQRHDGQPYLHLLEWQGWNDPLFVWRTLGYLAWLGQNRSERPILATIIYLKPEDDSGDRIEQSLDEGSSWAVRLPCVRLWEQNAQAAVASGVPGLLALTPLMGGASGSLVEQAAQRLMQETRPPIQGELLAALGMLSETLLSTERFIRLITKERLMTSDLLSVLMHDKVQEYEQREATLVQDFEQREATLYETLQQVIEDSLIARFPLAPARLLPLLRSIHDPTLLRYVHRTILDASDIASVIPVIEEAARPK